MMTPDFIHRIWLGFCFSRIVSCVSRTVRDFRTREMRKRWDDEANELLGDSVHLIPVSGYCYKLVPDPSHVSGKIGIACPFWHRTHLPQMESGYCAFLRRGDWQYEGMGLLWDQVKCCGINDPEPPMESR